MLQSIIFILHVLTCLMIVGLVLLQRGKGADAGTGFGAGASGTVFGARGSASFLSRMTAALATTFFVTSLALAYFSNQQIAVEPESLLEQTQPAPTETGPAARPGQNPNEPPPVPGNELGLDVPGTASETQAPGDPASGASTPDATPDAPAGEPSDAVETPEPPPVGEGNQ